MAGTEIEARALSVAFDKIVESFGASIEGRNWIFRSRHVNAGGPGYENWVLDMAFGYIMEDAEYASDYEPALKELEKFCLMRTRPFLAKLQGRKSVVRAQFALWTSVTFTMDPTTMTDQWLHGNLPRILDKMQELASLYGLVGNES